MPRYEVTAVAEGDAVVTLDAATEEDAERIAYEQHLCGIKIEGGSSTWTITDVRELD